VLKLLLNRDEKGLEAAMKILFLDRGFQVFSGKSSKSYRLKKELAALHSQNAQGAPFLGPLTSPTPLKQEVETLYE